MAIRPPKLLPISVTSIVPFENWTQDDGTGDPYVNQPYRWTVQFTVTAQRHSYHLSSTPKFYNGNDVQVGNWIATSPYGIANQIISISTKDETSVTCVVEDVDRFNTFLDPDQNGLGIGPTGAGFLFEIGEDGLPVLAPVKPGVLPFEFQVDLMSRFRYRNLYQSYYRVDQPSHNFNRGDLIYLMSNGVYAKAQADMPATARVVGIVQDSHSFAGDSSLDWFSYRPAGTVVRNLDPPLVGNPGDVVYLSDTTAGGYTGTAPTTAKPVFIRLNSATEGVLLNRGFEGATGEASNVYMVDTIAERDTLAADEGDQAFVMDAGSSEWAIFLRSSNQWVMLVNQDASDTDAETFSVTVAPGSISPETIARVSEGSRVTLVTVRVIDPFDDINASLSIGDDANTSRLLSNDHIDLSEVGVYQSTPPHQYAVETTIRAYFDFATSNQGQAEVVISYT